ncbi:CsbD family protein [Methylocystis rosea]|uniref:CsbD family protein n=1 Tax=Methylocystis rosea TaxID=173366 RepID=A0A3G8M6F6_9HYPH|nr:CsbD family protein [Methylocystis rosea]AZG77446.1 CsbD family protein [Methylocystis rosea]
MSSTSDKFKGALNETAGSAKQAAGKVIDSPELEGEGVLQEMKGKGQTALGEAKDAIADALDAAATKAKEVAKNAKDAIHKATE